MAPGVIRAVLLVVFVAVPAFATQYIVGDSSGWTTGGDYTTWASGKTFRVGDSLLFQYGLLHSVDEVGQSDYQSCTSSNSLSSFSDGNTQIKLTAPGTRYFICGTPGHCSQGMQLTVTTVSGSATSPSTTPAPSTPGGSPPTTPSTPETPTTPSTPATTPSTPATTPTGLTPTKPSLTPNAAAGKYNYKGEALLLGGLLMGLGLVV